jgi:hypothetical protein
VLRSGMRSGAVVVVLAAMTRVAVADPVHVEGAVAARVGSLDLDDRNVGPMCLHLGAGPRYRRFALYAEYDACGVAWSSDDHGLLHHVDGMARVYMFDRRVDDDEPTFGLELFVEAGGGEQIFDWDGGGGVVAARRRDRCRRQLPAPLANQTHRHDGRDAPTSPTSYDRAVLMTLGLAFGR